MTTFETMPPTASAPDQLEALARITMEGREYAHILKREFIAELADHPEDPSFCAPFNPDDAVDMSARAQFLDALMAMKHPTEEAYIAKGRLLYEVAAKVPEAGPDSPLTDILYLTTTRPSVAV